MRRTVVAVIAVLLIMGLAGCAKSQAVLSEADRALASRTDLPEDFLLEIKGAGQNLRQTHGMDEQGKPTEAKGVTIDVPESATDAAVGKLQASAPSGWIAFVSDQNFGIRGAPEEVSVLKASSTQEVIMVMGTNGINYDIGPDAVGARFKEWDKRFGLTLKGAGFDWLDASFRHQPPNMLEFAKEVYEFCPDVVDQGTGTVEALASEMKRLNRVYCWWD